MWDAILNAGGWAFFYLLILFYVRWRILEQACFSHEDPENWEGLLGVQRVAVRPSVSPAGDGLPGNVLRGKAGLAPTEAPSGVATSGPRFGIDENRRSVALFGIAEARYEDSAHS
jgi:hypothetical protein